jgi:hypothetical protein
LFRVEAIRCGDHDSVNVVIEQLLESREDYGIRRELQSLSNRIRLNVVNSRDFRNAGIDNRLQTIPSNPAKPNKAQPRH